MSCAVVKRVNISCKKINGIAVNWIGMRGTNMNNVDLGN